MCGSPPSPIDRSIHQGQPIRDRPLPAKTSRLPSPNTSIHTWTKSYLWCRHTRCVGTSVSGGQYHMLVHVPAVAMAAGCCCGDGPRLEAWLLPVTREMEEREGFGREDVSQEAAAGDLIVCSFGSVCLVHWARARWVGLGMVPAPQGRRVKRLPGATVCSTSSHGAGAAGDSCCCCSLPPGSRKKARSLVHFSNVGDHRPTIKSRRGTRSRQLAAPDKQVRLGAKALQGAAVRQSVVCCKGCRNARGRRAHNEPRRQAAAAALGRRGRRVRKRSAKKGRLKGDKRPNSNPRP